jgi:amidase
MLDFLLTVVIGKANLSELSHWKAYSRPDKPEFGEGITNGWSAVGGQTSAAYVVGGFDAGGDPSSSSAGSSVGVSAGFAAAALGTDTIGSVVSFEVLR